MKLGTPMQPRQRKSLEEILQAERDKQAQQTSQSSKILGTVQCIGGCGNVRYNAEPKEYYCIYCDEQHFHRLIA